MPSLQEDEYSNAALIAQFERIVKEAKTGWRGDIDELRGEFTKSLAAIKSRLSRPPGSGDASDPDVPRLDLSADQDFAKWVRANPGRKSFFRAEVPFKLGKAITPISGLVVPQAYPLLVGPQQPPLRLISLIQSIPITTGAAIWTREKTFTPGAAVVPETTLKPPTTLVFESITSTVETIATVAKASVQALSDMPSLSIWIEQRLTYAVQLELETLLLNAAAPNGILASGTPLSANFTPPAGATALDIIAGAIAQLESQGYAVDGVVMNAQDAFKSRLLKTTQGGYIWADPSSTVGAKSVWSVPIIISPQMPVGSFAVGGFGQSCLYFDRQAAIVEISFENEDDFIHNLACLRCECRGVLAIPVPAGLVVGTLPAGSTH
jgi:HK97 family phage major capsid protein